MSILCNIPRITQAYIVSAGLAEDRDRLRDACRRVYADYYSLSRGGATYGVGSHRDSR